MATSYLKYFPQPLLDDLVASKWLPVVGAGMSKNAVLPAGSTSPDWNQLGKLFASELTDYGYVNAVDAISAFEYEYGRPKLIEKLSEFLLIGKARPGHAHKAFCSIQFDLVCTTNFDFLLEKQYELTPKPFTPLIDEEQLSINHNDASVAVLKVHGDLNHPNRLVATEDDYDSFLTKFPLIATYLSNLLITRTAVLIGYSLDDPDFRQLWQVIGDRLGKSRRMAYVISIGAKPADIARFDRRGVKVVNLPGAKSKYGEILTKTFNELRDYWREKVVTSSHVTEEGPLRELSLPQDSVNRLCFFALPLNVLPFYRDRVFPIVRNLGLVPVTADDVISPGDNFLAKIDALLSRAVIVVVDASSEATLAEMGMAMARTEQSHIMLVLEEGAQLPTSLRNVQVVVRPDLTSIEIQPFLERFQEWIEERAAEVGPRLSDEPMRLLEAREYRAAIVSAITHLEASLRDRLDLPLSERKRIVSIRQMLELAREQRLLGKYESQQVLHWLKIRNEIVHTHAPVNLQQAREIVHGVREITHNLHW